MMAGLYPSAVLASQMKGERFPVTSSRSTFQTLDPMTFRRLLITSQPSRGSLSNRVQSSSALMDTTLEGTLEIADIVRIYGGTKADQLKIPPLVMVRTTV